MDFGRSRTYAWRLALAVIWLVLALIYVAAAAERPEVGGWRSALGVGVGMPAAAAAAPPTGQFPKLPARAWSKIEPQLLREVIENGTATFIVYLRDQADLTALDPVAPALQKETLAERRLTVVDQLKATAARSQGEVLRYLDQQKATGHAADVVPLWIFNGIGVTGDAATLAALAQHDDVVKIRANHVNPLPEPVKDSEQAVGGGDVGPAWNIQRIQADRVWQELGVTGAGVVVASLDTGVDWDHEALSAAYRGRDGDHNYNWADFTGASRSEPIDPQGHGTHVMGTIVAQFGEDENGERLQISVAPGAQWVSVKVCDSNGCPDLAIHQGFQWILAPTDLAGENPDPSKAPDIVNSSWGARNGASETTRPDIQALRAAGIIPVFSAGNHGDLGAGTAGSPGSYPESISVGATEPDPRVVAPFSSQGPSFWGETKPEVSAPGRYIRSSIPGDNYDTSSGTSMAAPHVTGALALMLEAAQGLQVSPTGVDGLRSVVPAMPGVELQRADPMPTIDDLEQLLRFTAVDLGDTGPDNLSGAGRIDAYRATEWAMTAGKLFGYVRDASTAERIAQATVAGAGIANPDNRFTAASGHDGEYSIAVPEGRYRVEVDAFGYEPQALYGVEVVPGFLSLRDVTLKRLPVGTVAGEVRTADAMPVHASVEVLETPVTSQTDGKGTYSLDLPAGTYTLRVAVPGYWTATTDVSVTAGEQISHTFTMQPAPSVLLVDADQWFGENISRYYTYYLEQAGIPFDTRPIDATDNVPTAAELAAYDIVVWAQPWTSPGYLDGQREDESEDEPGAVDALTGYLEQGGRLLLTGQDIGFLDGGGNPASPTPMRYFSNYLHAHYVNSAQPRDTTILGVADDILSGMNLQFDTEYAYKRSDQGFSPDSIEPVDSAAQMILQYDEDLSAATKTQADNYRVVYLGFSAETAGPRAQLVDVFDRAVRWLSQPVLSKSVDLRQAEPGDRLTYTLDFENGVAVDLEHVALTDPLPDDVTFVSGSATGGAVYRPATHTIEWSGGVPARDSVRVTFQVDLVEDLPGDTTVSNSATATVEGLQPEPVELVATATVRVLGPNLTGSSKTADKTAVAAGDMIGYMVTLLNTTTITASGATLVDPIPAGTEYVAGSATGGATYNPTERRIEWTGDVPGAEEDAPYTWDDSDTPGGPAYAWDNRAEEQGTQVPDTGDDSLSDELPTGFAFPFFDEQFTTFRVASNGFLTFTGNTSPFRNDPLPSPDAPDNLIAPFWDDFDLRETGSIFYWSNNQDTLVVSWVDAPRFGGDELYTFQIILHSSGRITLQYQELGSTLDSATIGIQNADGTEGVLVVYNDVYAHEELAVRLRPPSAPVEPPVVSFAVEVNDDVAAGTWITNTAHLNDGQARNTELSAASQVYSSNLSRSRKLAPSVVLAGGSINYTIVLSNTGELPATVAVTDPLPAETEYLAGSATGGAAFDAGTNTVSWTGDVSPDDSQAFGFTVRVDSDQALGTVIRNLATIDDGLNPSFMVEATTTLIGVDLSRSAKFASQTAARSGDIVEYAVSVENRSPVPANTVSVVDELPEGLTYVLGSLSPAEATYEPGERMITWRGDLPARGEGYAWDDSDSHGGVVYAWDERPETEGVRVRDVNTLGDDTSAGPFPVGFSFPFYDDTYDEFYVSTNGFASFSDIERSYFSNRSLPQQDLTVAPPNLLAAFWDDLDLREQGDIYYWSNDVDTLVISWVEVPHLGSGGPYTFQIVLRSDGTIQYQYKSMAANRLDQATIGIQNNDGSEGLTVVSDEPYVHNELAVHIAPPGGREIIRFQAEIDNSVGPETVIVNRALITDAHGNEIEREARTVVNTLDLTASEMTADRQQVALGEQLTYQLDLVNQGTADATETTIVNPLPADFTYVADSATNGAVYDAGQHAMLWEGVVPSSGDEQVQYSVEVGPPAGGTQPVHDGDLITNTAMIHDGVHVPLERSAVVQIVAPDLSRSTKAAPPMVGRDATLTYHISIVNSGQASAEAAFTDVLPAGVAYVDGSAVASFGGPLVYDPGARTLTWSGTVPARGIAELRFGVSIVDDNLQSVTNTAQLEDGLGATLELAATTRVVEYRTLLPLIFRSR